MTVFPKGQAKVKPGQIYGLLFLSDKIVASANVLPLLVSLT